MKRLLFFCLIIFALATSCVKAPLPAPITGHPLLPLADIDNSGLFAANPDGTKIAIARDGLSLFDVNSKTAHDLSLKKPVALAWSPDGLLLAVAFEGADYETELLLYSADGRILKETSLPVVLSQLVWSRRGDLLAAGFALKIYTFGGNLRQLLYTVDLDSVEEILLSDSTLRPALARQVKPLLHNLLPVAFSPQGDELVFLRLHDPPEFSAYFQMLYRNWQVDSARELDKFPLQAMALDWNLNGDSIRIQSETGQQTLKLWPAEVQAMGSSSAEEYRFHNGQLYRGSQLVVDWGDDAQIQWFADGTFLLAVNRQLYRGSGLLKNSAITYNETDWNLRRWRYEELVTPEEYKKLRQEIDK